MEDSAARLNSALTLPKRSDSSMPTYEYTCKKCGQTLEVFQSFSEKPLRKHAECGGELQKVFHARGVVFKGSGFYSTDSRTSSSAKSGQSNDETKRKDDSKPKDKSKDKEPAKKGESSTTAGTGPSSSSSTASSLDSSSD
jgi:putative FmdB family regulatory protein